MWIPILIISAVLVAIFLAAVFAMGAADPNPSSYEENDSEDYDAG